MDFLLSRRATTLPASQAGTEHRDEFWRVEAAVDREFADDERKNHFRLFDSIHH
jgi:hypothetical protein